MIDVCMNFAGKLISIHLHNGIHKYDNLCSTGKTYFANLANSMQKAGILDATVVNIANFDLLEKHSTYECGLLIIEDFNAILRYLSSDSLLFSAGKNIPVLTDLKDYVVSAQGYNFKKSFILLHREKISVFDDGEVGELSCF